VGLSLPNAIQTGCDKNKLSLLAQRAEKRSLFGSSVKGFFLFSAVTQKRLPAACPRQEGL